MGMNLELNNRALLVQFSISQWSAIKRDKRVSREVAEQHNATSNAGNYNKKLFPAEEKLSRIHAKSAFIRQELYRYTLPWGFDGTYILPTRAYFEFMETFREHKADWEWLVDDFVQSYDELRQLSERLLGSMYDAADYPSKAALQSKFSIELALIPVPTTDFRVEIPGDAMEELQRNIETQVQQAQMGAIRDVCRRLHERVQKVVDKLEVPGAIFRDSLLDNAREACDMIQKLNFTDDPELESIRKQVEFQILSVHTDTLRNDPDVRAQTAGVARNILDSMSVFMGGSQ